MAVSGRLDIRHSIPSSGDIADLQYRFVYYDANGQADAAEVGGPGFVLVDRPEREDEAATVILVGKTKVELGEPVDAGDFLAAGADGVAVEAAADDTVLAIALEGGVAGQIVTAFVVHFAI